MRKPVAAGVAVVVMVIGLAGCGAASTTVAGTPTVDRTSAAAPVSPRAVPGPVRDGGLQFHVVDVSQVEKVGDPADPGLSITARGVFVVVTMSIRNVGSAPLTFFDRYQTLVDGTGQQFPADMAADIYGNRSIRSTRIEPGEELLVHLSFDVPQGTVAKNLILRQSDSTTGVTVPIS